MMLAKIIFLAMPFLGIRIGVPMLSGGGNTTPPTGVAGNNFPILGFN